MQIFSLYYYFCSMWFRNHLHQISLVAIMLVAIVLRFLHFNELPFMWDELSAWSRLQFDNFSDLIQYGVMPDGHPAGVQVFLYYYTILFGDREWVVKLPFNLMGIASIYLFYLIGKIWYGEKSALISASFMASLQFFVLYSTIARPYISGLFLTLFMVLFWSKYFFQKSSLKNLLGFIIFAALSAYNHHFSLLFAAIVGVSGLFLVKKIQLPYYVLAGVGIFFLYLPHLPVFFNQLGIGGIGGEGNWLGRPDLNFPVLFFKWAFQYSWFNYILVGLFLATSIIFWFFKNHSKNLNKNILLIFWFGLPLAIGLGYSIYINPVIQYSVLIFSFPYFILFIFASANKIPDWFCFGLVILILSINIFNLVNNRRHYEILSKQPFDVTAQILSEESKNREPTFCIFDVPESYQLYYFNKYEISSPAYLCIYDQNIKMQQLDSLLSIRKEKQILFTGLPPAYFQLIKQHYPFTIKRLDSYTMESYLMSKDSSLAKEPQVTFVSSTQFKFHDQKWSINPNRLETDSLGESLYLYTEKQEWGFSYKDSLKNWMENSIIDLSANITIEDQPSKAVWVSTINKKDSSIIWRGQEIEAIPLSSKKQYMVFQSYDTQVFGISDNWNQLTFETYLWNKGLESIKIREIKIQLRRQNPIRYGLFSDLK